MFCSASFFKSVTFWLCCGWPLANKSHKPKQQILGINWLELVKTILLTIPHLVTLASCLPDLFAFCDNYDLINLFFEDKSMAIIQRTYRKKISKY